MSVRVYATPADFDGVTNRVYRCDPVRFTLELTTLRSAPWRAGRILASVGDDDAVGAVVEGGDGCLLVSGLPGSLADEVVNALSSTALRSVRGERSRATAFATAWGVSDVVITRDDIRYRLGELVPPVGVAGADRQADTGDDEMLADWMRGFLIDAQGIDPDEADGAGLLRDSVRAGAGIVVWTVDGVPASMARVHAPAAGAARIGPVYTPPALRGRGYGAAVTAAAVDHAWRRGARDVVLFADSTNPSTNRLYRRIGFVPHSEHVELDLVRTA